MNVCLRDSKEFKYKELKGIGGWFLYFSSSDKILFKTILEYSVL